MKNKYLAHVLDVENENGFVELICLLSEKPHKVKVKYFDPKLFLLPLKLNQIFDVTENIDGSFTFEMVPDYDGSIFKKFTVPDIFENLKDTSFFNQG